MSDAIVAEQSRQNRTTERQWQMYASHRRNIERLIVPSQPGGTLCVLGAGNCNDLDLRWLTEVYREVHLVDLDAEALRAAVVRQKLERSKRIVLHAPFDLTGIAERIAEFGARGSDFGEEKHGPEYRTVAPGQAVAPGQTVAPGNAATFEKELWECARLLGEKPVVPWPVCDVVLSPCVLSQTIVPARDACRDILPASHPAVVAVRRGLRARHLNLMAGSLKPGGRGVLVLDLVSSEKVPQLARIGDGELPAAMDRFISSGKHFHGLEPRVMRRAIAGVPQVDQVQVHRPWLWHLGLRKSFLVYGISFCKG